MSVPMKPNDPAYFMLTSGPTTTPVVHSDNCYICNDPEFAQMGMPLCYKCYVCEGHVAADDTVCDDCGKDQDDGQSEPTPPATSQEKTKCITSKIFP